MSIDSEGQQHLPSALCNPLKRHQLLTKEPLLQGKNDVDQVSKIFDLTGPPNSQIWPGFRSLPNAKSLRLPSTSSSSSGKLPLLPRARFPYLTNAGQVLVFELNSEPSQLDSLVADEVAIVSDHRFTWKGREKLQARAGTHKQTAGYQLSAYVQLSPPAAATSTDLRSDWHLLAVGTSYGFVLYDYSSKHTVINRCTLNVQDFAIVSGDAGVGAISRKKSFRKSLRESFRRLRRGRSQRQQQLATSGSSSALAGANDGGAGQPAPKSAFSRGATTGVRTLGAPPVSASSLADTAAQAAAAHRNFYSGERQVEFKNELSSIVKCITLTSAIITSNLSLFKPSLWVGTNSGSVLVYAIDLASEQQQQQQHAQTATKSDSGDQATTSGSGDEPTSTAASSPASQPAPKTAARLTKEIQLKHKAPIIAIFTSPEAPAPPVALAEQSSDSAKSTPVKNASELFVASSSTPEKKPRAAESEPNEGGAAEGQQQQRVQTPTPSQAADKSSPSGKSKQDASATNQQARVLICSEEQFKVFNLPNMKPFCKFKLTAQEGLRAKKISITQFLKPAAQTASSESGRAANVVANKTQAASTTTLNTSKSLQSFATQTSRPPSPAQQVGGGESADQDDQQQANGARGKQQESNNNSTSALNNNNNNNSTSSVKQDKELLNAKFGVKTNALSSPSGEQLEPANMNDSIFEPYMVCMSNQGDCAIYSVPDLKRQAQIQVCKREDVNGITSAMLTNHGEGYYLRSSSNFLRFSISSQRVLRVMSVI